MLGDVALHERDHFDHQLIGVARRFREGEDTVLGEQQALDLGVALIDLGCEFSELEARHDIGHETAAAAEDPLAHRFGIGQSRYGGRGDRMGVVDEFMRQVGV